MVMRRAGQRERALARYAADGIESDHEDWFTLQQQCQAAEASLGLGAAGLGARVYRWLAPYAGRVREILAGVSSQVDRGGELLRIDRIDDGAAASTNPTVWCWANQVARAFARPAPRSSQHPRQAVDADVLAEHSHPDPARPDRRLPRRPVVAAGLLAPALRSADPPDRS